MKPYNQEQTKKEQVEQMFDNIAPTYDKLNHILSFNIDRIWRRRVMRIVRRSHAKKIMDVATGTGDLAIAMAKRVDRTQILGIHLSEEILQVARKKIEKQVPYKCFPAVRLRVIKSVVKREKAQTHS